MINMQNTINPGYESTSLIESNPMDNGNQAPIYLLLDWDNETIDAGTYYEKNSMPMDIFHNLRTRIQLPGNIDASHLKDDIDDILQRLDRIQAGYSSEWNGHNWIGKLTAEAEDDLQSLRYEIETDPVSIFRLLDDTAGVWDVSSWFENIPDDITSDTTDEELETLADYYNHEAKISYDVILKGGEDSVYRHFVDIRDEMKG